LPTAPAKLITYDTSVDNRLQHQFSQIQLIPL